MDTHQSSLQEDPFKSYKIYQPTPPVDSDSDSSSDQFAARFAVAVQHEDRDDDMMDDTFAASQASDLPWGRTPQVIIGPPTPVSEMGPGPESLDIGGDVDMDRRQGTASPAGMEDSRLEIVGTERKKTGGFFRMGFRADCEKCRMRVPGHYSHF